MARVIQLTGLGAPQQNGPQVSNFKAPPHRTELELGDLAQGLALGDAIYKSPLIGGIATGGKKLYEAFTNPNSELDARAAAAQGMLGEATPASPASPPVNTAVAPQGTPVANHFDAAPGDSIARRPAEAQIPESADRARSNAALQELKRTFGGAFTSTPVENGPTSVQPQPPVMASMPQDAVSHTPPLMHLGHITPMAASGIQNAAVPGDYRPEEEKAAERNYKAGPGSFSWMDARESRPDVIANKPETKLAAFEAQIATVSDMAKLDALYRRLPDGDPRKDVVAQRAQDLQVSSTFAPPKAPESKFEIDPRRVYTQSELESMAHAIARGGGTEQDRKNLMEAFKHSDGRGVSIGSLGDLVSGEHITRAGDKLSAILASGIPKKSPEELAIEAAYKGAMGGAALGNMEARQRDAETNSVVKPRQVQATEDRNATDEGYKLGTGKKATPEGQKPGGMLGIAGDKQEETKAHNLETEGVAIDNAASLKKYREAMSAAARTRAAKAGRRAKVEGMTLAQQQAAELRETAADHRQRMSSLDKEEGSLNAEIRRAEGIPRPSGEQPDADIDPNGAARWQKQTDEYRNAQRIQQQEKATRADIEAKRAAVRQQTKADNVRIRGNRPPAGDAGTPPAGKPLSDEEVRRQFEGGK